MSLLSCFVVDPNREGIKVRKGHFVRIFSFTIQSIVNRSKHLVLREPDDKNFYEKIEELQDWGRSRPDSVKEISMKMSTDEEKASEPSEIKDQERRIREFKKEKRNAKSQITRLLNKLAGILRDENPQQIDIKSLFKGIQDQQDRTLAIMTRLEEA